MSTVDIHATRAGDLRVILKAPCEPYGAVDVAYGPLTIAEETSLDGTLALDLPRIAGARTVSLALADTRLEAEIPRRAGPAQPYLAVRWPDGERWGTLALRVAGSGIVADAARPLGFPRAASPAPLDFVSLPDGARPLLIATVRAETCGGPARADIITSDKPLARPLQLTMPGCNHLGEVLTVPLN